MKFLASQIAALLGGTLEGDPNAEVWNVAKIEEGAPGMLSFLANPKYTPYLYETKSSVVIVNNDFEPKEPVAATLIRVADAYASFAKLLAYYDQLSQDKRGCPPWLSFLRRPVVAKTSIWVSSPSSEKT